MDQHARERADFVPHLPDLLVSMARCRRAIRDAQSEVDPFGPSFAALEAAGVALDALARRLTGQRGFFALAEVAAAVPALPPVGGAP